MKDTESRQMSHPLDRPGTTPIFLLRSGAPVRTPFPDYAHLLVERARSEGMRDIDAVRELDGLWTVQRRGSALGHSDD